MEALPGHGASRTWKDVFHHAGARRGSVRLPRFPSMDAVIGPEEDETVHDDKGARIRRLGPRTEVFHELRPGGRSVASPELAPARGIAPSKNVDVPDRRAEADFLARARVRSDEREAHRAGPEPPQRRSEPLVLDGQKLASQELRRRADLCPAVLRGGRALHARREDGAEIHSSVPSAVRAPQARRAFSVARQEAEKIVLEEGLTSVGVEDAVLLARGDIAHEKGFTCAGRRIHPRSKSQGRKGGWGDPSHGKSGPRVPLHVPPIGSANPELGSRSGLRILHGAYAEVDRPPTCRRLWPSSNAHFSPCGGS
jgi:hypothetical protein